MTKLLPSRLKIDRAKKHITDLEVILRQHTQTNPYRLVCEVKPASFASNRIMHHYRINTITPLPDDIPLLIGDAIHNLRVALDLFAYDIITTNGGSKQFTGFPFEEEPGNYDAALTKGKVAMVPDKIKKVFRAVEAYKGGRGSDLWHMNKLDIIDKHRLLLATSDITGLAGDFSVGGGTSINSYISNQHPEGYLVISDRPLVPHDNMALAFKVVLAERDHLSGQEVVHLLRDLADQTLGVIEKFEAAIFGVERAP